MSQDLSESTVKQQPSTSLRWWGITTLLVSFLYQYWVELKRLVGRVNLDVLKILFDHGQAATQLAASAIGTAMALPIVLIAVTSLFKAMRNSRTRWKIVIACSIATVLMALISPSVT